MRMAVDEARPHPTRTLGLLALAALAFALAQTMLMIGFGPLSGRLAAAYGAKVPLTFGGLFAGAGLLALGVAHATVLEILVFYAVLCVGIALAFAAMANLILEAVPAAQTGEATGFNTVMRSVGASLGSQVTASMLAGATVAGASFPATDGAYRDAFVLTGCVALAAAVVAVRSRAPTRATSARHCSTRPSAAGAAR